MATDRPSLWSVRETAAYLNVGTSTVLRLIGSGQLRAVRIGKQWRLRGEDVERLAGGTDAVAGSAAGEKTSDAGRRSPVALADRTAPAADPATRIFRHRTWETDSEPASSTGGRGRSAGQGKAAVNR